MTDHISTEQMAEFRARTLSREEFAAAAGHLAHCEICLELFRGASRERSKRAFSVTDLSLEHWLKDEHFDAGQLVAYADDRLDSIGQEMAGAHLKTCASCREELRRFLEYKRRIEPWMQEEETAAEPRPTPWKLWDWFLPIRKPAFIATAAAILALLALGLIVFHGGVRPGDHTAKSSPSPAFSISPNPSPSTESSVAMRTPTPEVSPPPGDLIASLNDNGMKIIVNASGEIRGVEGYPPLLAQNIKDALIAKEFKRPVTLSDLDGVSGSLRGGDGKPRFALIAPARTVLAEARPTFEWEPLKDATAYQVFIGDLEHRETVISKPLPATTTQWTPATPLRRGRVYSWAVTAKVNGEDVTSPGASAPEPKFKILEQGKVRELAALKKRPRSHLALGVFYMNAGMTAEAEREFQMLAKENPRSPIPAKLLRAVLSWR